MSPIQRSCSALHTSTPSTKKNYSFISYFEKSTTTRTSNEEDERYSGNDSFTINFSTYRPGEVWSTLATILYHAHPALYLAHVLLVDRPSSQTTVTIKFAFPLMDLELIERHVCFDLGYRYDRVSYHLRLRVDRENIERVRLEGIAHGELIEGKRNLESSDRVLRYTISNYTLQMRSIPSLYPS